MVVHLVFMASGISMCWSTYSERNTVIEKVYTVVGLRGCYERGIAE